MLRIRDKHPGWIRFFPSSRVDKIPVQDQHQRIQVFFTQNLILSSQKLHPGCLFRIPSLDFFPSRIKGSESTRYRIRNTDKHFIFYSRYCTPVCKCSGAGIFFFLYPSGVFFLGSYFAVRQWHVQSFFFLSKAEVAIAKGVMKTCIISWKSLIIKFKSVYCNIMDGISRSFCFRKSFRIWSGSWLTLRILGFRSVDSDSRSLP